MTQQSIQKLGTVTLKPNGITGEYQVLIDGKVLYNAIYEEHIPQATIDYLTKPQLTDTVYNIWKAEDIREMIADYELDIELTDENISSILCDFDDNYDCSNDREVLFNLIERYAEN